MIVFPNCKINLGLHIISRRPDNYHDLETVFYPINFTDALEIISSERNTNEFTVTGLNIGSDQTNLCYKAYHLLKNDFPGLPFIKMHLHKAIPVGAGLGGGSADAAFTLKLLNEKYLLGLSDEELKNYALWLGSDCPFFLYNEPCFASGRGEQLEPLHLSLSSYKLMLINPAFHIDTPWAFSQIKPATPKQPIKEVIEQPIETWKHALTNDFEMPVFKKYPEIENIKQILYQSGALYASLTGSGSTVYGIFKSEVINVPISNNYFIKIIDLK